MSELFAPTRPLPSKEQVTELLVFLAASADVSKEDGQPEKAKRYQEMYNTVKALSEQVDDLFVIWGTRRRVGLDTTVYSEHATEAIARDWIASEPRRTLVRYFRGEWHDAPTGGAR